MLIRLQAHNGKLVCAENGGDDSGLLKARTDPAAAGSWELFDEADAGNGTVTLSCTATGTRRYWSAQPDGKLVCNRVPLANTNPAIPVDLKTAVGPWERFTKAVKPGGVSYQAWNGKFACADEGQPETLLSADRPSVGAFETFTRVSLEPHLDSHAGALAAGTFDPSNIPLSELARIRGAMWTCRTNLPFGPRPGQDDNITALEYIYSYHAHHPDTAERAIKNYKSRGYTHACIGPINAQSYHGQYPDQNFQSPERFEVFLDWLQYLWDRGLTPVVFLHFDGATLQETKATYTPLIQNNARAKKLLRVVVPTGWEPTKYDWSSQTWAAYCQWARELLPNALVLIHTVSDVDAPVGTDSLGNDNGRPNAEGWARVVPFIHGWLVQSSAFEKANEHGDPNQPAKTNFENWVDYFRASHDKSYINRFHNGYAGWPRGSAWGPNTPIKVYAGEYAAYWSYWQNRPESESLDWGDAAMKAGADGYLDGGRVAVPSK